MKGIKAFSIIFMAVMVLSLFGCGSKGKNTQASFSQVEEEPLTPAVSNNPPTEQELERMLCIFDSIVLSSGELSGRYSGTDERYADILLMYVINNYNTDINGVGVKQDNNGATIGFEISVSDMNSLATACFSDVSSFVESPRSTEHFQFETNGNMYVLTDLSDRGAPPYPRIKSAELTAEGKYKVGVDFLNEEDNFFASTYYFYLVPNTRDLSGAYPWSVENFEPAMTAARLYTMLPLEQMSHNVKLSSGSTPLYQPVVVSWEEDATGTTAVVVARMYRYNKSKKFEIKDDYVINEYYEKDDNDGDYKFTLAFSGDRYIIKNMEKK